MKILITAEVIEETVQCMQNMLEILVLACDYLGNLQKQVVITKNDNCDQIHILLDFIVVL